MARIRTIKPEFWRNEQLSAISAEACLLAVGLLNHCDDEGYFNANPKLVEADVFPLRELSGKTTVLIQELVSIGYINLFSGSDGKTYGHIVSFERHQVINKKKPSVIKDLCELPYEYGSDTVPVPVGKERKGKEHGMEMERKVAKATATSVACPSDVSTDCWEAFIAHRKAVKALVTDRVVNSIRNEADKAGIPLQDALDEVVARGWKGFKADWYKPMICNEQPRKTQYQLNQEATARALGLMPQHTFDGEVYDVETVTKFLG